MRSGSLRERNGSIDSAGVPVSDSIDRRRHIERGTSAAFRTFVIDELAERPALSL